jgi:Glycosyl transferases group 1
MRASFPKLFGNMVDAWRFKRFEKSVHPDTWRMHDSILQWAEDRALHAARYETPERYSASSDPVVRQGHALVEELKQSYFSKLASYKEIRLLVHLPGAVVSPGGYSAVSNLVQSLQFLGVPVRTFGADRLTEDVLEDFKPSVMLIGDFKPFLSSVDWRGIERYRRGSKLLIGLSASLEEYGNSPLKERLSWSREHDVSFYFTFRSQGYVTGRKEYVPFFDEGYRILSIEFGVNPLVYYPVPEIERDLNYVFLASSNSDKLPRYISFLSDVLSRHSGIIDGPGWSRISTFTFNAPRDRYLYARAKVGINLHLEEQIEWASELNERTYMLAACGTPQVVDNPKILGECFSQDAFFVASSPREYTELFESLIGKPTLGSKATLKAQKEVFGRHTTFHRTEQFVALLQAMM